MSEERRWQLVAALFAVAAVALLIGAIAQVVEAVTG